MTIRAKCPTAERPPTPRVATAELEPGQQLFTTTVRITRADWLALRMAAQELVVATGQKTDSSSVLRSILAAWRQQRSSAVASTRATGRKRS